MNNNTPTNIETTTNHRMKRRVTFTLDGIDCEVIRYKWDGPVYMFADLDRDGIREPIKAVKSRAAFALAFEYGSDEALAAAKYEAREAFAALGRG